MMQINSISRQNELYTNSTESNGQNRTISDTPSSKEHIGVEYIKSEHNSFTNYSNINSARVNGSSSIEDTRRKAKLALKYLGFYAGPDDDDLSSSAAQKAIIRFQKVYGLNVTGTADSNTLIKLDVASNYKSKAAQALQKSSIPSQFYMDYYEKDNFARTWAFLCVGMGLSEAQASGVLGNIKAESNFSSDNAEWYAGAHNPDYKYNINDKKGYGIMQWTAKDRKYGLLQASNNLLSNVSDINVQLLYMRIESNTTYKSKWDTIKTLKDVNSVSDYFLKEIESPNKLNYAERRSYSNTIYNVMSKINYFT